MAALISTKNTVDVILLCGGKGTRFREVTGDKVPKSLYKLNGEELIQFSINNLDFSLVHSLIFAVDHHADSLKDWVVSQSFPCPVFFSYQTEPGVLGAVNAAARYIQEDNFIICNTDELRKGLSVRTVLDAHCRTPALSTMVTAYSDHLFYHRVITTDDTGLIESTELNNPEYQDAEDTIKPVNTGLIIFNKDCLQLFNEARGSDWSSIINPLVEKRLMNAVLNPDVRYFNIGTKHELEQARAFMHQEDSFL